MRSRVASAYKTFHKIQKRIQFLIPGFLGVDSVSIALPHSQPVNSGCEKMKISEWIKAEAR